MNVMKKSKFINKYDYIGYYTKPKFFWFYKNSEIVASLNTIYQINSNKNSESLFDNDENEIDELEAEIDAYEIYQQSKEEFENIDKNNSQIAEGLIIDKKTKKFISEKYAIPQNIKTIDFDDEMFHTYSMEQLANITKEFILEYEDIVLFQPVFIFNELITKPDAFVKYDNNILIIETKGTSTAKKHHFLDLLYQKNVIESQKYLIDLNCIYDYFLCLVKYEKLNKNEISFVITPYINYSKSISFNKIITSSIYSDYLKAKAKIGYHITEDTNDVKNQENAIHITIKSLINGDMSLIDQRILMSVNASQKKALLNAKNHFLMAVEAFDDVVTDLINHKNTMNENDYVVNIYPSINDKGYFKNFDYFSEERKIYSLLGYNRFNYSGNIAYQSTEFLNNCTINEPLEKFIKQPKNGEIEFLSLFDSKLNFHINEQKTWDLFNKLKNQKVYFDFETLNTAIRVADNTFPFTQIITQCSIIKNNLELCNNLIIDPLKIDNNWYKKIVDEIYDGPEPQFDQVNNEFILNSKLADQISYVVYNKSFECSRLKEIKEQLNDQYYSLKIDSIIKNIFDIADFFVVSSQKGYLLFFKELGGFYSIKKVLPLVEKYAVNLFKITKCLNYNSLDVSNGKICQEKTAQRFFKKITDAEWDSIQKYLQIYCENDVRAMIAVEYFINDLINKKIEIN